MKAELAYEATGITHVASDEPARPVLTCVRIGNGEIAAVDGFILARHPVVTDGNGVALIPRKAILAAKQLNVSKLRSGKGMLLVEESDGEATISLTGSDSPNDSELGIKAKVVNGSFPNIDNLYLASKPSAFIAFSPTMLAKLAKVAGQATVIKLRIRGKADPVEFIAGDTTGLIMPMFTQEEDQRWHRIETTKKKQSRRAKKGDTNATRIRT